jgi:hypothetical protein
MDLFTQVKEAILNNDLNTLGKILADEEDILEMIGDEALEQENLTVLNWAHSRGYHPSGEMFGHVVVRDLKRIHDVKKNKKSEASKEGGEVSEQPPQMSEVKELAFTKAILGSVSDVGHAIIMAAQYDRKDLVDLFRTLPDCDNEFPDGWMGHDLSHRTPGPISLEMFNYLRGMIDDQENLIFEAFNSGRSDLVDILLPEYKSITPSFLYVPSLLAMLINRLSPDQETLNRFFKICLEGKLHSSVTSNTFEVLLEAGASVPNDALRRSLNLRDVKVIETFIRYGAQDFDEAFLMEAKEPRSSFKLLELLLPKISEEVYRQVHAYIDDIIARKARGHVLYRKTKTFMLERRPLV